MSDGLIRTAGMLRQELSARNAAYATMKRLPHVLSYGERPVVVYPPSECGQDHGNFISASYRAILKRPEWRRRLQKVHSQGNHSLPKADCVWRELDSSMSSDALLMNIFCYPGVTKRREVSLALGTDLGTVPQFGFMPRVPLVTGMVERTEVDMKLGDVLFEAKLTEGNFQAQDAGLVQQYRDLKQVFECSKLPRQGKHFSSYQLLRNVLAAYALNLHFCVLLDARRPDLLEQWYRVMQCIRSTTLRTRCKVLTWQELAPCLPSALRKFLLVKYGITGNSTDL
jgi:Restriction Endonuclease associating with ARP